MALSSAQVAAQIALNESIIAGYQAALLADSADPKKTYTKDGESLSRNEWRAGLIEAVASLTGLNVEMQKILNGLDPYVLRTRHML